MKRINGLDQDFLSGPTFPKRRLRRNSPWWRSSGSGGVKLTTLAFSGFHCRKKTLQLATQEAGLQFATLDDLERRLTGWQQFGCCESRSPMVEFHRNLVNSSVRRNRGGCGGSCTCWKPAPQFAGLDLFGRVQNENFVYMMFFLKGQFFLVLFPVTCTCPACPHHKVECTGSRAGFTELLQRFSRRWNEPPEKICWRFVYVIVVSAVLIKPMPVLRSGSKKPIFHWGLCDEPKGLERSRKNAEGVAAKKRAVRKAFIWTFLKDSLNFC